MNKESTYWKAMSDLFFHAYLYYECDNPEISDYEFDSRLIRPEKIEEELGLFEDTGYGYEQGPPYSITCMVGWDAEVFNLYVKELNKRLTECLIKGIDRSKESEQLFFEFKEKENK